VAGRVEEERRYAADGQVFPGSQARVHLKFHDVLP
jgi:hypothetical protein